MSAAAATLVDEILERAAQRGREKALPYRGAVTPQEAWALAQAGAARIVDVRTKEEWALVGRIPGAEEIEWKRYADWALNPEFVSEVRRRIDRALPLLLVCRSAQRSHDAAAQLAAAGYDAYNVLEGFEGDKSPSAQRTVNGWKVRGLPWYQ